MNYLLMKLEEEKLYTTIFEYICFLFYQMNLFFNMKL